MKNEIEATFLSVNKSSIRTILKEADFELKTPEYMMRRKTFDFPSTLGQKKWGRVRQESDKVTMTVKEIRGTSINDTYETELIVNDFDTENIASIFTIRTNPTTPVEGKTYLILGQDVTNIGKYKTNYNSKIVSGQGVDYIELDTTSSQTFDFFF